LLRPRLSSTYVDPFLGRINAYGLFSLPFLPYYRRTLFQTDI